MYYGVPNILHIWCCIYLYDKYYNNNNNNNNNKQQQQQLVQLYVLNWCPA